MPANKKNVLTTGQVAKICNVAPRTVSKWFDSGQLPGYRIPGSRDRRIPLDQLVRFMRANGIPLNGLDAGATRVLIVDHDAQTCEAICRAVARDAGYEVSGASSAFEAGMLAQSLQPQAIVVDLDLPGVTTRGLSRAVRSSPEVASARLIGIGHVLGDNRGQALLQDGFDAYLPKPFEVRRLIELIEAAPGNSGAHA
ncbi:MAG TPA: helix-turn-helix domain-containing protein [Phycisphaerae bacterium]|nr:helix-turn-helix domain-containing protein [Phycisphaerae bacterium]HNU45285.1 helix-turn-helix domain-containing protein [Phycisphaerae bacterium]